MYVAGEVSIYECINTPHSRGLTWPRLDLGNCTRETEKLGVPKLNQKILILYRSER